MMKFSLSLILAVILLAPGCGGSEKKEYVNKDAAGPSILAAVYSSDGNSDLITLEFDKAITFSGLVAGDFELPVSGDSLGTAPTFAAGVQAFEMIITLDCDSHLTPAGDFDPASILADDPSGIDLAAGALPKITDSYGNPAKQSPTLQGALDISE